MLGCGAPVSWFDESAERATGCQGQVCSSLLGLSNARRGLFVGGFAAAHHCSDMFIGVSLRNDNDVA